MIHQNTLWFTQIPLPFFYYTTFKTQRVHLTYSCNTQFLIYESFPQEFEYFMIKFLFIWLVLFRILWPEHKTQSLHQRILNIFLRISLADKSKYLIVHIQL